MSAGTRASGSRRRAATSLALAAAAFAAFTVAAGLVVRVILDRDRMIARNEAERVMNGLFTSLRDHEDFGSAIEAQAQLRSSVVGVGMYGAGGLIYSWGRVPAACAVPPPEPDGRPGRDYRDDPRERTLILVSASPGRRNPPPPPDEEFRKDDDKDKARSFLRDTMRETEVTWLELRDESYWSRRRLVFSLFAAAEAACALLALFVRRLVLRNREYRELIEEQRNLVIVGTAASTLAHEIKNPLLAIRLQTRILAKTCPPGASRELGIIDEEVERLSSLSHRVNDYLRDPRGSPAPTDAVEILRESGRRLCGRDLALIAPVGAAQDSATPAGGDAPTGATVLARIDPERLRSILDNLLRNALESGGPESEVAAEASVEGGKLLLDVLDRGTGVPPSDRERIFDPFFTTKGRGTGVGLAICRRFAEAAGGTISLSERPGGGTRARLVLPVAGPEEGGPEEAGA